MSGFEDLSIPWSGWQIVREIGRGGYGTVYEIERTQSGIITNRAVIKVIRIPKNKQEYEEVAYTLSDEEEARAYFVNRKNKVLDEIKAMTKLRATRNVAGIEEWHVKELEDGYSWEIYIRKELLTPLKEKIRKQGDLDELEIIKLGKDICNELMLCEKEGIILNVIEPNNIFVDSQGHYKLLDDRAFKILEDDALETGVSFSSYSRPEQHNDGKTDKTSDIYSLGLVMYELLNNRISPYLDVSGKNTALKREQAIQRILDGEDIPEPEYGSPELKRIVLKACSFNPSDRYKSAEDMFEDLKSEEHSLLHPRRCFICGKINPVGSTYCGKCGIELGIREIYS